MNKSLSFLTTLFSLFWSTILAICFCNLSPIFVAVLLSWVGLFPGSWFHLYFETFFIIVSGYLISYMATKNELLLSGLSGFLAPCGAMVLPYGGFMMPIFHLTEFIHSSFTEQPYKSLMVFLSLAVYCALFSVLGGYLYKWSKSIT